MARVFNLGKGDLLNLGEDLSDITVGLSWDRDKYKNRGKQPDLKVFALLNTDSASGCEAVYVGKEKSDCGSISISKENLTAEGEGGDEQLYFQLKEVPSQITSVDIWIVIYEDILKRQNFSQIRRIQCRLSEGINGQENGLLATFDMYPAGPNLRSIHVVSLLRKENNDWGFERVEESYKFDNRGLEAHYKHTNEEKTAEGKQISR
ncbi:hypothetical protein ONZ43_g770 [Nemania bipapillata]|uniref:Uncharacterized protein n=1 Tax=Nemania bipapillata TaxID=110536 RepID=A0ACC2J749_9PEZI|nr:hypothetical protein ONZ43_g770 [Nemania bipapillata]